MIPQCGCHSLPGRLSPQSRNGTRQLVRDNPSDRTAMVPFDCRAVDAARCGSGRGIPRSRSLAATKEKDCSFFRPLPIRPQQFEEPGVSAPEFLRSKHCRAQGTMFINFFSTWIKFIQRFWWWMTFTRNETLSKFDLPLGLEWKQPTDIINQWLIKQIILNCFEWTWTENDEIKTKSGFCASIACEPRGVRWFHCGRWKLANVSGS